jgi:pyridoxamine 5'-phosphate oxidase
MMQDPIKKFKLWWDKANENSSLKQPNAACLSTINKNGFPSGRFVDLKGVENRCFIFCTSLESKKAQEIKKNSNVGLTIWWDHMGFQVRIIGTAVSATDNDSARHWQNRSREAQITSVCSNQSEEINGVEKLSDKIEKFKNGISPNSAIPKPSNWGCYEVQPKQIEFLTFSENRLHLRELYEKKDEEWSLSILQP